MLDETASGVFTIAATPFLPDGQLDLDSLDTATDFYIERGANGLTILGMMGEAGKLSMTESVEVIRQVVKRSTVPVVVGVSAPGLAAVKDLAMTAMDEGAAGVMVAPIGTLRTDSEIKNYFVNVANALDGIPFVLQDFPLVTGVKIDPSVILEIIDACPNCVMLKHEDWPGLDKISALRNASSSGARRISILCGNGGLFLPEEVARGADGAMTGFAYPEMMRDVVSAARAGQIDRAHDIFDVYLPLIRFETQPGIGLSIRKEVLKRRGAIAHSTVRPPGPSLSEATIAELNVLLDRLDARRAAF